MVAFSSRVRPYSLTTVDAVNYKFFHIEQRYPRRPDDLPQHQCCFMTVSSLAAADENNVDEITSIDCFRCFTAADKENNANERYYDDYCRQRFATALLSHYSPLLTPDGAAEIADTFVDIAASANATYRCTDAREIGTHTLGIFEVDIMTNSFEVEMVGPRARRASKACVRELLEVGDCRRHRCVICMEMMMRTRTSTLISMPCLHVFHKDCIVEWLDNSHVCPLCRYELPVDQPDCSSKSSC